MSRRRAGDSGIALLLAVWLLAVLAAIAAEFLVSTRVKAAAERNQRDGIAAYALAQAGYRAALAAIGAEATRLRADGEGRLLVYRREEPEGTPAEAKDVPLGEGGTYSWRLESEDGRLDINGSERAKLVAVLAGVGLELGADRDSLVNSILDWKDGNREHRNGGAEEDYYRGLDPPYSCKDGPFDLPEELLLVRGMKPVYFTGGAEGSKDYGALRDLVTVCPVTFMPATAPQRLLDALGQTRPAEPAAIPDESFFRVLASGRSGTGPERSVLAVVQRIAGGAGSPEFALLYWHDNHIPDAQGEGAER